MGKYPSIKQTLPYGKIVVGVIGALIILSLMTSIFDDSGSAKADTGESCYQLGVKYGRCVAMSLLGIQCHPGDDIIIPPRCRGEASTERGIEAGVKSISRGKNP